MNDIVELLRRWSLIYRTIGSPEKADLLDAAVMAIRKDVKDDSLAGQLLAMASMCEANAHQQTAAGGMRAAAALLAKG